ncbi:glycosyltransferase family 29 protein [Christiangramia fulva]|uniref:glycosyltransferase family 29 protein n=1 Tax=Christiangramia fulva TaxID=2126553 RepID=UPI00131AEB8B|nr:glycosyltransferase family 29 protein [Christiangramia fulva]
MNKVIRHLYGKYLFHISVAEFDPVAEFSQKKIAVIGAADTALIKSNREIIEASDIVIRVNKAPHAWEPSLDKYMGKRIDILYHSFFENEQSGGGEIDLDLYTKFGIQKIINPNNNSLGRKAQLNFYKRKKQRIPTYLLNKEISENISSRFGSHLPTIGFYALASSLIPQTEQVFIAGFSFFKTAYYKGYRDHLEDQRDNENHIAAQGLHSPDKEFQVFKDFLRTSPSKKIILDDYLEKIIEPET